MRPDSTWTTASSSRQFERVAIDVEFATEPILEPEMIVASELLAFADVDPVRVPALAIEQHVAEKLHAYTRTYAGDSPSSRVKDLVDLVVIANTSELDAKRLTDAIEGIFDRRATHEPPAALPAPPDDWGAAWRRLVMDLPADAEVDAGHRAAAKFPFQFPAPANGAVEPKRPGIIIRVSGVDGPHRSNGMNL